MMLIQLGAFAGLLFVYVSATVIHLTTNRSCLTRSFRMTAQNISIGGINRHTTIANGLQPGPPLRLQEGDVTWIRVYNEMSNANLKMASRFWA